MEDIAEIPAKELLDDLANLVIDKISCEYALLSGATEYGGDPIVERIKADQLRISEIRAELCGRDIVYRLKTKEVKD